MVAYHIGAFHMISTTSSISLQNNIATLQACCTTLAQRATRHAEAVDDLRVLLLVVGNDGLIPCHHV